jgi:hypothetical protein
VRTKDLKILQSSVLTVDDKNSAVYHALTLHKESPEAVRHEGGRSQMQGGKNWFLPKEINANGSLLRLSLAGNLEKPLMSPYGTKWRERGYVAHRIMEGHVYFLNLVEIPRRSIIVCFLSHRSATTPSLLCSARSYQHCWNF